MLKKRTAQRPLVPNIGQKLQLFTGNGDVSIRVKHLYDKFETTNQKRNLMIFHFKKVY